MLEKFAATGADGWACWAFSNHDVVRPPTRWALGPDARKAVATLLLSLRGSVCLYQGEELGLPEADVAFEDLEDPYGIEFWPEYKGRDGCRTPMVWTSDARNGGFSSARPWLPVSPAHLPLAVGAQDHDPDSVLAHYRAMLGFRKRHPALVVGELTHLDARGEVLSFRRVGPNETLFCAFNLSDATAPLALPRGEWVTLDAPGARTGSGTSPPTLPPWHAYFARRT